MSHISYYVALVIPVFLACIEQVIKHTDDSTKLKELHKKRKQHVDDYLCNIQFDGTDLKVPPLLFACLHNRPAIIEFLLEERAGM